jgi:hypothetical protein
MILLAQPDSWSQMATGRALNLFPDLFSVLQHKQRCCSKHKSGISVMQKNYLEANLSKMASSADASRTHDLKKSSTN